MTVEIPRRSFNLDIDGKVFLAKELSVAYLQQSIEGGEDTADLAIIDSMGEIKDEDLHLFGIETKNVIYGEILKFTFDQVLSAEDISDIKEQMNMSEEEINSLDRSSKAQLKSILLSRIPRKKDTEKKILPQ